MEEEVDEHRIFVGNLSNDIDEWDLDRAFVEYGPTFNVNIPRRGFGFVSYFCKQHAERAIEEMDGQYLEGRPIRVEWAFGWPKDTSEDESEYESEEESEENDFDTVFYQTSPDNCTVYCGGLTGHVTRELIEQAFNSFGVIEEISVFDDRDYAFIRFQIKESAALAICEMNGTEINGEPVRCSWSHRPNYHNDPNDWDAINSSSDSRSESSHSVSPAPDNFDTILNQSTPENCTVYCGGLSGFNTEESIENIFSPYGDIDQISLYPERNYAFIRFNTKIAAALAICALNGEEINGETVRCSWSHRPDYHIPVVEDPAPSTSNASNSLPSQAEDASNSPLSQLDYANLSEPQGAAKEKSKNPDLLCKICMDEELGMVFLPCGHLASCARCAKKIFVCPMCRKRITGKVRTYLS